MANKNRRAFTLLALSSVAASLLLAPTVGSATSLSNTPFQIKAASLESAGISSVKGMEAEPAPAPELDRKITMTVNTALPGCTPNSFSFTTLNKDNGIGAESLPLDATVSWGDGSPAQPLTGSSSYSNAWSHSYPSTGSYELKIDGTVGGLGSFNSSSSANCISSVDHFGADTGLVSMSGLFSYAKNLTAVAAPPATVRNMSQLFLNSNFNGSVSGWDTSNVENMESIFNSNRSFNQSLSSWDVSKVKNFGSAFAYASAFNGDVSTWRPKSATNMSFMFSNATTFNGNISDWRTTSAIDMNQMFSSASSFKGDLSQWDVSSVKTMPSMFWNATQFNSNLSQWNVSNVTFHLGFQTSSGLTSANLPRWVS